MKYLAWLLRRRIPAYWNMLRSFTHHINRRAAVEEYLLECARGKRPLPDAERCRRMALKLGIPGNNIRIDALDADEEG